MKFEDYENLPDKMRAKEVYEYFEALIADFSNNKISKYEFLENMYELALRQVFTYEILKEPMRIEIDELMFSLWDSESFDTVDAILSIMVCLGLEKTFNLCKQKIANDEIKDDEIRDEIVSVIQEIGSQDISNPYRSLS